METHVEMTEEDFIEMMEAEEQHWYCEPEPDDE